MVIYEAFQAKNRDGRSGTERPVCGGFPITLAGRFPQHTLQRSETAAALQYEGLFLCQCVERTSAEGGKSVCPGRRDLNQGTQVYLLLFCFGDSL